MRRWAVVAALLLVTVTAAGALLWWRSQPAGELDRATGLAPPDAERLTWTDWRGVRTELGSDVGAGSTSEEVSDFLDAGFEADLTSTSALVGSAQTLHERFGFSPATLDWELFSQSGSGAVLVMRLDEDVDVAEVQDRWEELGYARPDEEGGVWRGGADLVTAIAPGLTPQLQHLALDADERLVLASDAADYLDLSVSRLGGGVSDELSAAVAALGETPLSAVVYDAAYVCSALAMGQADAADQAAAERLVAEAGGVDPMTAFALAELPGGGLRLAMTFESEEQARANADSRATLLAGPAPGQGGSFADRFSVTQVAAEGEVVTADLAPQEGQYVLSDLTSGPVLFATC